MRRTLGIAAALAALMCTAWAGNDYMGQVPPDVNVGGWLNQEDPSLGASNPILQDLRGRVVLIEFWSTT